MSWPADIDSSSMTSVYAVANTPPYLFKHLRHLSEVERLGHRSEPSALAMLLGEILGQADRTPGDAARAYAILAAMTFRDYAEWRAVADALDLHLLDWGEQFRRLMKSFAVPTSIVIVEADNRPHLSIVVDR